MGRVAIYDAPACASNVVVAVIKNPFEPWTSREVKELPAGRFVREYVQDFFPIPPSGFHVVATVNGRACSLDRVLIPGDSLAIVPVPEGGGGGGGGKNPIGIVASLALTIAAPYLVPAAWAQGLATGLNGMFFSNLPVVSFAAASSMIGGAITLGGGLLISSVFSPSSPSTSGIASSTISESPTYSWEPVPNTTTEGGCVPVLYGTHLIQPPVIGRYISTGEDKQTLNVLCLVADHECDSITGFLVNDQPIAYFEGMTTEVRLGSTSQTAISNFLDTYTDTAVGYEITTDWKTFACPGNTAQRIGIGVSLPGGLYYVNDSGGLDSQTVTVEWQYRAVGSATWLAGGTEAITAATKETIKRYFATGALAAGNYELRARFTSAPPTGTRYGNRAIWEYVQEIVTDDFSYPGRSLASLKAIPTEQLSGSSGAVTYKMLATRSTVQVWNPATSAYVAKAATNPAWACYDALHHQEYGLRVAASLIDYARFSEWADWCDDQGYTVNIYIQEFTNVRDILDTIGRLGRGRVVQSGSTWTCTVDRPETIPAQRFMFNVANVERDSLEITYLDLEDRANAVEIFYYDADLNYTKTPIYLTGDYFDATDLEIKKTSIDLVGCTDRSQAIKYGRFLLNSNRYLTVGASWTADVDSIACQPGDVVDVQHDVPQWGYGGRVVGVVENLLPYSSALSNWSKPAYTSVHDADVTTADGIPLALVTDSSAVSGQYGYVRADSGLLAGDGGTYCFQAVVKPGTSTRVSVQLREVIAGSAYGDSAYLDLNPSTGVVVASAGNASCSARGDGTFIVVLKKTMSGAATGGVYDVARVTIYPDVNATGDGSARIGGCQLEVISGLDAPHSSLVQSVGIPTSEVILDREVTLEPGKSYALQVKLDDDRRDTVSVQGVAETTTTDTLTIADAWAYAAPKQYDLWQFGEVGKVSKSMRIVSITQAQDQKRKITALEYVAEVYDDDADIPAPEAMTSLTGVNNLTANRYQGYVDGLLQQRVSLAWTGAAVVWNVYMKRSGGSWRWLGTTSDPSWNVTNLPVGWIYTFAVTVVNKPISAGKTVTVDFTMDAMAGDYQQMVITIDGVTSPLAMTIDGTANQLYYVEPAA